MAPSGPDRRPNSAVLMDKVELSSTLSKAVRHNAAMDRHDGNRAWETFYTSVFNRDEQKVGALERLRRAC